MLRSATYAPTDPPVIASRPWTRSNTGRRSISPGGDPAVRGWFWQDDHPVAALLYRRFSAPEYVAWLHRLGRGLCRPDERAAGPQLPARGKPRQEWRRRAEACLRRPGISIYGGCLGSAFDRDRSRTAGGARPPRVAPFRPCSRAPGRIALRFAGRPTGPRPPVASPATDGMLRLQTRCGGNGADRGSTSVTSSLFDAFAGETHTGAPRSGSPDVAAQARRAACDSRAPTTRQRSG